MRKNVFLHTEFVMENCSSKNLVSVIVFLFMDFELNSLCCSDSAATDTTQPRETGAQDRENRAGPSFMESNQDILNVHTIQTRTAMGPLEHFHRNLLFAPGSPSTSPWNVISNLVLQRWCFHYRVKINIPKTGGISLPNIAPKFQINWKPKKSFAISYLLCH